MDNHRKKKDNATTFLKINPRPSNVIGHIHNDGACPQSTQKKESWIGHKFGESGRVWTFMATSSYGSRLSCVYFPPHFQMVLPLASIQLRLLMRHLLSGSQIISLNTDLTLNPYPRGSNKICRSSDDHDEPNNCHAYPPSTFRTVFYRKRVNKLVDVSCPWRPTGYGGQFLAHTVPSSLLADELHPLVNNRTVKRITQPNRKSTITMRFDITSGGRIHNVPPVVTITDPITVSWIVSLFFGFLGGFERTTEITPSATGVILVTSKE